MTIAFVERAGIALTLGTAGAWTDYDLYTAFSIPKGAIVVFTLENATVDATRTLGVRIKGSSLERKVALHENESAGDTGYSVHMEHIAQTDANGYIQYYCSATTTCTIRIVGYFTGVTFTELWDVKNTASASTWEDVTGYTANRVYCVLALHNNESSNPSLGVRTNGSSLARYLTAHETEGTGTGDGWHGWTYFVKADASGIFEIWTSDATKEQFDVIGYFDNTVDFVENMQLLTLTTFNAWTDLDISAYLDIDGRICAFILGHSKTSYSRKMGVRINGSALDRRHFEHEAETNAYAGFSSIAQSDASGIIEYSCQDVLADHAYYLTGYFKDAAAITYVDIPDSASGSELLSKLRNLGAITDAGTGTDTMARPNRILAALAESATGSEFIQKLRNLGIISEGGSGSDIMAKLRTLGIISEIGSGSEAILMSKLLALLESAIGSEIIGKLRNIPTIAETGQGTDTATRPSRTVAPIIESATGSDIMAKLRDFGIISDAGSGTEVISKSKMFTILESATGSETLAKLRNVAAILESAVGSEVVARPSRTMVILESASGIDVLAFMKTLAPIMDSATATEVISKLRNLGIISETATGTEILRINKTFIILDTSAGTEAIVTTKIIPILVIDAGIGSEGLLTNKTLLVTSQATGSEQLYVSKTLVVVDSALGAELISRPMRGFTVLDFGTALDVVYKLRQLGIILDIGIGNDIVVYAGPALSLIIAVLQTVKMEEVLKVREKENKLKVTEQPNILNVESNPSEIFNVRPIDNVLRVRRSDKK